MSERIDLTRWNRAGLTRFRYVDGNAVEYLEILRQKLVEQFADPKTGSCEWLNPPEKIPAKEARPENETLIQRQERLSLKQKRILETYHQDRRDWAWEITRTFARSCHILTEYANAYANEGFLGTATQWDHLRRLVAMLDYHPAPPASASTPLVFIAKGDQLGTVAKGFQVKNSPPTGGDKVVFETLQDLVVDPALNELRPAGWDQPNTPVVDNGAIPLPNGGEPEYSVLSNEPVTSIQGVGEIWAGQLQVHTGIEDFRIRDFLGLDLDGLADLDIGEVRLNEFKAKATVISLFEIEPDWSDVVEWLLPEIAAEPPESLAEKTGNSPDKVKALQLRIELIGVYLDQAVYSRTKLRDLLAPAAGGGEPDGVPTSWRVKQKPKVTTGDVAMIFHKSDNKAEAATISKVDETTGFIELRPSPMQHDWLGWPKSQISLFVSPRWKRKPWLNGANVIRTVEPHGLSADTYICWTDSNRQWTYARVTEVDTRDLRLDAAGSLPVKGTDIYVAQPFDGDKMAAEYEEIVLLKQIGDDLSPAVKLVAPELKEPPPGEPEPIFWLKETPPPYDSAGGGLLPPASLPKIGSFLFPSPMLPMDLVKAAVEMLLSLGVMQIPSSEEFVIKGLPITGLPEPTELPADASELEKAANALFNLLNDLKTTDNEPLIDWHPSLNDDDKKKEGALKDMMERLMERAGDEETVLFKKIEENMEAEEIGPLLAIPKKPPVKAIVETGDPVYMFNSTPDNVKTGDWVVGRFADGLRGLQVRTVDEFSDSDDNKTFSLSFTGLVGNEGELQKVYADFRGELIAEDASFNTEPVRDDGIELEQAPDTLQVGRDILLAVEGEEPLAATIESIDGNIIKTKPPATGFPKGALVIRGNVALVGHGESKPQKILGSGDATQSNQEFTLAVDAVSFTPDATMSSGVAAAIDVEVAGRIWEQVSTLKDSAPDNHHYAIRMTEDGYVKILFGDGQNGRRLPSGKNNLRVRYRVGSGIVGNLAAASLEKPVNPHPLIETVHQPLPATGGGDMEGLTSLRVNAPPTLLALERAVSLSDFSHLAAAQSSIWQAQAYSQILQGGRMQSVRVVIVPAGGVSSEDIESDIKKFLQKHALPGVQVSVSNFETVLFDLMITVRVNSDEFIPAEVRTAVTSALTNHFTLRNRKLGEYLYLSEIYKIVEGVHGVENSICVLNNDENLKVIEAVNQSTVIYLDPDAGSSLAVTAEEYLP